MTDSRIHRYVDKLIRNYGSKDTQALGYDGIKKLLQKAFFRNGRKNEVSDQDIREFA